MEVYLIQTTETSASDAKYPHDSDMKFNMYEFALMSRFIELGRRYGLEPWQFGIEYDRSTGETYVTGGPAGQDLHTRFVAMLSSLGMTSDGPRTIPHEEGEDMLEAIDKAIESSPRKWAR